MIQFLKARLLLILAVAITWFGFGQASAQEGNNGVTNFVRGGEIHGNFQAEAQYYNEDTLIGAVQPDERLLMNGFANFTYTNNKVTAGVRYESYQNALLGFPEGYKGNGFPYRYFSYTGDALSFTVGNFYEQFGNGLVLRTYEERGLGYDNAIDGIRVIYRVAPGVHFKGVIGQQRKFFDLGEGIVRGFDAEFALDEMFASLADNKGRLTIGGSFVSKYQPDNNPDLVLPENVGIGAARFRYRRGKVIVSGEYSYKINDPSFDNGYIYKEGQGALLQASYSRKGLGIAVSGKRVDNMSYRSERDEELSNVLINYIPSLTRQHTYNLLATLYPYATQLNGEMAFQADVTYKLKKKTALGGKYGTTIALNYSLVNDIDRQPVADPDSGRQGYTSDFFKVGDKNSGVNSMWRSPESFPRNSKGYSIIRTSKTTRMCWSSLDWITSTPALRWPMLLISSIPTIHCVQKSRDCGHRRTRETGPPCCLNIPSKGIGT